MRTNKHIPGIAIWLAGVLAGSVAHAQAEQKPEAAAAAAPVAAAPVASAPGEAAKPEVAKPDAAKPDTAKPGDKAAAAAPSSVKVERTAAGKKLFRITEGLLVEGQMQKPNAFYVLQRAAIDYDWEALDESFLPRIRQATLRPPF